MNYTGSADKTIKIWRNGECIQTIEKHTEPVRGIANVPGVGFLTCSNDG
jgi:phospholipase A-2-activating protein